MKQNDISLFYVEIPNVLKFIVIMYSGSEYGEHNVSDALLGRLHVHLTYGPSN